jgi:hypothetical protein
LMNSSSVNPIVYEVFGDLLANPEVIRGNGDYLRRFITDQIIASREINGVLWLESNIVNNVGFLSRYPHPENYDYFIQRLRIALESGIDDDAQGHIVNILRILNEGN